MDQGGRAVIEIVTALIRNQRGHVLLVRKRGTTSFLQPGGKRESGESNLDSLARELREELGCDIVPGSATKLGVFEAPAANEPGQKVRAALYAAAFRETSSVGPRSKNISGSIRVSRAKPGSLR
jgi:8-oxo-dGTP pyrophosphatase MutT (NUDIX family)